MKTESTTQVSSVDFVTADNANNILRSTGLVRTATLRVDNSGGNPAVYFPEGGGGVDGVWGNIQDFRVTGTPDVWLVINVNGTNYVFPGYVPEG